MDNEIRLAKTEDAPLVHQVMMSAFKEYRTAEIPSSALNETVESIKEAIQSGTQKAFIYYLHNVPVGSIRFKEDGDSLYFVRLSVCPEARKRGIAKALLSKLEENAKDNGKSAVACRVRMSVPQNIQLYQSVGYRVCSEEIVTNSNGFDVKTVYMRKEL